MTGGQTTVRSEAVPVAEAQFDPTGPRAPVGAVVDAIASAREVDPTEVSPLHGSVDTDALNHIFSGDVSEDTVVGFSVEGLQVFVRGSGRVRVYDPTRSLPRPEPLFAPALPGGRSAGRPERDRSD